LKNGKVVAITDAKGQFKLKDVNGDATIIISFTGYAENFLPIDGKVSLKVTMSLATNKLDEAQVIAYGATTERLSAGDVTKISSQEIAEQPVTNVLSAIEGRVPGLYVQQTSGMPGGSFTVQIRGQNSFLSGTDPFYVIDGVPYNSELPTANGNGLINSSLNGGNPLNFINPYDIESVEVLKDADATAIYGSRAANGAILITTKRGKAGRMTVSMSVNSGASSPTRYMTLMNTPQYLTMRNEAFRNDGTTPSPNSDFDLTFWDTTRYTNWADKFLYHNKPVYTDVEGSVSGGTTNMQYLIGGGYNRQTSGLPSLQSGTGADGKESVHFNINGQSPDKRFKISLTGSYLADQNMIQPIDLGHYVFQLAPDAPALFNTDGSLNWDPMVSGQVGTWNNPYSNLLFTYKGITSNLVGGATVSYSLLPGLELKTDLGYTITQTNEVETIPTTVYDPGYAITSGSSEFSSFNSHSWIIEPQANYKLRLGKGVLTVLGGGTFHENDQAVQILNASGFISDALLQSIQSATDISPISSSSTYKYDAMFGRVNFDWRDKYILNLNARRDGSSRFGPGKQFGDFGSVGAAWIFSKENLVQRFFPALSFGKLRASHGTTGNDQIGDYQFLNLYSVSRYPYEGNQGLTPSSLYNPELAWELDKKLEVGIELGFLKDRILLQANYYRNRSGNQLVEEGVSLVTGFSQLPANLPALIQNSGEEMALHTINVRTKKFTWTTSINLSIPRNKLLSFPGLATSSYADYYKVGQPINSIAVFHMTGVNDTTGVYEFSDFKGNPTYSPNSSTDLTSRIKTAPEFFGGVGNNFAYKGFSLDVFFQFVKQKGINALGLLANQPGAFSQNVPTAFLNRWQSPGDKAKYEQYTETYSNAYSGWFYAQQSDFAYSDASFMRLKNIAASWQLPKGWRNTAHLQNARIFLQAQNLITFTQYFGIDPEIKSISSPPKRVITAGLQLSL
jgi:TonB-linked SusC/RagA family outer membrane protein